MNRSLIAVALAAFVAVPFAASAADGVSYNYVEGGYVRTNASGAPKTDGWGVRGSVAVHQNFHLLGEYASQDISGTGIDVDNWRLGVGYNHALTPNADLLSRVAYEKYDAGFIDADGWAVEVGARSQLLPNLEGHALLGYQDNDLTDGLYGRLGAQWKFNQNWGLSGEVKIFDGGDKEWFVGPRVSW